MGRCVWHGVFARYVLATVLLLLVCVPPVSAASPPWPVRAAVAPPITQLIVKFKPLATGVAATAADFAMTPARLQSLAAAAGVPLKYKRAMADNAQVVELPYAMDLRDARAVAAQLKALSNVQYAEPDRWLFPAAVTTPNDPYYSNQWYLSNPATNAAYAGAADLPGAWNITTGSTSVVVGVVDTGVLDHADLKANLIGGSAALSGYDLVSDPSPANSGLAGSNDGDGIDSDPTDPGDWVAANDPVCGTGTVQPSSWHGTHVAGIIGAVGDNSLGITGIDWTTKILMVRALGVCGGLTSDIVNAVTWAAGGSVPGAPVNKHPARVINLSLGASGSCGSAMQSAINFATKRGATVVVAAGNGDPYGTDVANFTPANCSNVITVAAVGPTGDLAYYSNYDTAADHIIALAAPGGEIYVGGNPANGIYSTYDGGTTTAADDNSYAYEQGTSMATPVVSGTVALMLAADPALTNGTVSASQVAGAIKQRLQATARPFPTGTGNDCTTSECGAGIVDAAAAVKSVTTPPIANAGTTQAIYASSGTDTLDGSASSDPYGTITSYVWTQTAGSAVTLSGANTPTPSFTVPATAQTLTFDLTVADDVGLQSSASVNVDVTVGPVITSISPTSGKASGAAFTLTVNGIDFTATSVVDWNGSVVPTTYVSATQLTAQISTSDLQDGGAIPVTVVNGSQVSKAVSFDVIGSSGGGGGGAVNPAALLVLVAMVLLLRTSSLRYRTARDGQAVD